MRSRITGEEILDSADVELTAQQLQVLGGYGPASIASRNNIAVPANTTGTLWRTIQDEPVAPFEVGYTPGEVGAKLTLEDLSGRDGWAGLNETQVRLGRDVLGAFEPDAELGELAADLNEIAIHGLMNELAAAGAV